ncbi:MAG: hypothetical protein Q3999_08480 [Buchananella hordeovulneris]|nr:hypothetical protein [Buchananella hordeovulneris]
MPAGVVAALGTGALGGLTTFSTVSVIAARIAEPTNDDLTFDTVSDPFGW